jgi:hypothetical protein
MSQTLNLNHNANINTFYIKPEPFYIINVTSFALCSILYMLNHTIRWTNNFENMNFMMYWWWIKYFKNIFMFHD